MPALLINGVDARTLGLTLGDAPGWLDAPPREIPTAQVSGRAGAVAIGDVVEGVRQFPLTGTVMAATVASARAKVDAIKWALLASPLSLIFADQPTRYVRGHLKSFSVKLPQGAQGPFVQETLAVEAVIQALDPYYYDNDLTTLVLNPSGTGYSFTYVTFGTGPSRPVIEITGAIVNPNIGLHDDLGALGSMNILVTNVGGDTLVIDMDAKTVKKNGVSILSLITAGDFFTLDPLRSSEALHAHVFVTPTAVGTVAYRRSWR